MQDSVGSDVPILTVGEIAVSSGFVIVAHPTGR